MHSHPSPSDIQTHLYNSFLQASTYDVALRVTGSWNAIYKLHRVVLIQSGFFRSLFTAGFSESAIRQQVNLHNGTDEISVVFDDHNITRAAFEICISRLYGGGPALYVLPNLIPTTNHPFIPQPSSDATELPVGSHPATPRFLLSLLATSIYLSIPSIASQALSLVLKTVGPTTVIQYLSFACGKPFDYRSDSDCNEPDAAVGLENVAQILDDEVSTHATEPHPQSTLSTDDWKEYEDGDSSSPCPTVESSDRSDGSECAESSHSTTSHHYGVVSDKIGEACACWLTRWAIDILQLETQEGTHTIPQNDTRSRSKSLSSFDPKTTLSRAFTSTLKGNKPPVIFGIGGLSAEWVSAIVCADTLFVKGERQRYNLARSIVELRRRDGVLDHEEQVWNKMFEQGIYYVNMTFDDILFISQDLSPTTNRPYVSQSVLHASHWTQSIIRHHIMQRSNSLPSSTAGVSAPSVKDKELGIALTTADILSTISNPDHIGQVDKEKTKIFFPVLGDSSLRIGENGANTLSSSAGTQMSMEDFFNVSQSTTKYPRPEQTPSNSIPTTEEASFGIAASRFSGQTCVDLDLSSRCRWTPYPPYRFSVEFWDVDLLKEKSRLHSQTIWHAGSLFNVYVQVVRKKGQAQLGIYLHRQSSVDPIPASSAPSTSSQSQNANKDGLILGSLERAGHLRQPSLPSLMAVTHPSPSSPHYSPSIHPLIRSTTPSSSSNHARSASPSSTSSSPSPSSLAFNIPATTSTSAPQQPYRDPRSSVSAYFAISCASATGSSQTRFSSSPDVFTVSQSWGWKSSTLRTEDFMEIGTQPLPSEAKARGEEVSFRATVILGLV